MQLFCGSTPNINVITVAGVYLLLDLFVCLRHLLTTKPWMPSGKTAGLKVVGGLCVSASWTLIAGMLHRIYLFLEGSLFL